MALERLGGDRDPSHRRRPFKGRLTGAGLLGGAPLGEWIGVLCDQAGAIFRLLDARLGEAELGIRPSEIRRRSPFASG